MNGRYLWLLFSSGTMEIQSMAPGIWILLLTNHLTRNLAGGIYNFFQFAENDLGLIGPDQGKGGKYLVIPPGNDESKLNTKGYFVVRPSTNKIMFGVRFLTDDASEMERIKDNFMTGPYGGELHKSKFIANTNKVFRGHPRRGLEYFEDLHKIIQNEPISREDLIFKTYMNDLDIFDGKHKVSKAQRFIKFLVDNPT